MANETIDDITGGINAISGSAGRIITQQIELVTLAIQSVAGMFEPLGKNASNLVTGSLGAVTAVLDNVSSALDSKK
ncbi:MAG: hypothetical protein WCL43_04925 [Chlorobium sp.]|jgi:hypothetical protein|nr:MAG: hypothetical protein FDX12_09730 [Chlorobium sp.]